MTATLFAHDTGRGDVPVVLLHGFGASHVVWEPVIERLAGRRRTLAYDLPGHGGSLAATPGGAGTAARAVLADLAARDIARAHLVGHSMGGAAAALAALAEPDRIASLTLLAPGGFGPEIDHRLLRRYAAATEAEELAQLLEPFFGLQRDPPQELARAMAMERREPGASAALQAIIESFFDGTAQKVIPVAKLAALAMPIKVLWGTQDRVLPTRQAHRLPGRIAVHIFEGVGHMLPLEAPDDVAYLVLQASR